LEISHLSRSVREPLLVLLRAVVWMLPVAFYLRHYDHRPALEALGLTTHVRPRGLLLGCLPALAYLALITFVQLSADPAAGSRSFSSALLQIHVFYMLLSIVLEELLMRGFLLGQFVRFMSSLRAQLLVALLFALMHLPGWIAMEGFSVGLVPMTISLFLLGLVLGLVVRTSGSVLPAIVLHSANNVIAEWLSGA
jgi:membrane protease YdiL (CAAX protease family)